MRKVDRLFEIIQLLRGRRLRTAQFLAGQLGVSTRTIYRDIQGLMASGVPIEGERGIGYLVQQPIELPPLQFTALELQTIKFGLDLAGATADADMGNAAQEILIKINDVLPKASRDHYVKPVMRVYIELSDKDRATIAAVRKATDGLIKLELNYANAQDEKSTRVIRPLSLEYWGKIWTLTAWCELRDEFRAFRIDRIASYVMLDEKFTLEVGKRFEDYLEMLNGKNKDYPHC